MSQNDSVFDARSKVFAHLSHDNRLHLWDVDTRKERKGYVDKNHLSHNFTCFNWNEGKNGALGEFVVGFSDGVIIIWDLIRGVISKTIGKANETDSPTDIAFSRDRKSIFVSSNQNRITKYNISTGEVEKSIKVGKKGIFKLAVNQKSNVIAAASSSIRLVDVETEESKKLEASFSGGITALAFSPCGWFLAAASAKSREILIFDVRAKKSESPVLVVPVNGIVSSISTKSLNGSVAFLVVFEETDGCVFRFSTSYEEDVKSGVNSLIALSAINSHNAQILSGNFVEGSGEVVLAVGQKSHPLFVHVKTEDEQGTLLKAIHVNENHQSKSNGAVEVNGKSAKTGSLKDAPEVLGPHEMGGVKRPLTEDYASSSSKKSKNGESDLLVASTIPNEMTLEQRLESLSRNIQHLEDESDRPLPSSLTSLSVTQAPTTDSLVTLIDQALQSGDDALLEQCLICNDNDVVEATARRLPTGRIVVLLRKLVAKFEKRPSRGLLLTRWLSSILRYHTSYLVTVPDLSFQLAGLSQMLEQRLSSYTRLSSLAGRLDLLLSQVSYQKNGSADKLAQIVPQQVYQEK